jgi:hypothetical protein
MEESNTLFYSSKFPWTREKISSKLVVKFDTRLQKSLFCPGLGCGLEHEHGLFLFYRMSTLAMQPSRHLL